MNNLQVNKMKKQKKQQRGSLTLLFTAIVLCILVMTVFIVVAIAFLLIQTGLLKESANYFSFTTQAAFFSLPPACLSASLWPISSVKFHLNR